MPHRTSTRRHGLHSKTGSLRWPHLAVLTLLLALLPNLNATKAQGPPPDLELFIENPDYLTHTQFPGIDEQNQDPIYIRARPHGSAQNLDIKARRNDGRTSKFILERFDISPGAYKGLFKKITEVDNVTEHTFHGLPAGGYRLLAITPPADTLTTVAWCFEDIVTLNSIRIENSCQALYLQPQLSHSMDQIRYELLVYYDYHNPTGATPAIDLLGRNYFKDVRWTLEGPESGRELLGLNLTVNDPPLYQEARFILRLTNLYGRTFNAETPTIKPMAVGPKMRIELNEQAPLDLPPQWSEKQSPVSGQSPFHVRFYDQSQNADSITLHIRNDPRAVREGALDTIFAFKNRSESTEPIPTSPTLFRAGEYTAILHAYNAKTGCHDTAMAILKVDSSLIAPSAIPNVFSPNDDGINDIFQFIQPERNVRSIAHFHIAIYTRQGQRLYQYEGNPLRWPGWDGSVGKGHKKASPGVYFYVIRASGWDGQSFRSQEYRGALHLYR